MLRRAGVYEPKAGRRQRRLSLGELHRHPRRHLPLDRASTGDADNAPASSPCNAADESVFVARGSTTLRTDASANVGLGDSVHDTAIFAGGSAPGGQISFRLYGPDDTDCSNAAVFTSQKPVTGNGNYASANFTPTAAGTYRWTAVYSGDPTRAATSPCNAPDESVTVAKTAPTITTDASPSVELGGSVHDTATLAGGSAPTGQITFRLYGPGDPDCTKVAFTTKRTITGNGDYVSAAFAPSAAGVYRWRADYSGDSDNAAASSDCNAAGESVGVAQGVADA